MASPRPLPLPLLLPLLLLLLLPRDATPFTCDGGRHIPDSYVADDYCDCADASDEISSGACPDAHFTCANAPHAPRTLPASRVGDGVCDCCDGSDEPRRAPPCANACVSLASRAAEAEAEAMRSRRARGEEGRRAAAARRAALDAARAARADGGAALGAAVASREAAEAAEGRRRGEVISRLEGGEVARAVRLEALGEEGARVALVRLALGQQVAGVDRLHEMLAEEGAPCGEAMGEVDAADVIEVAMEAREEAAASVNAEVDGEEQQSDARDSAPSSFEAALLELLPLDKAPQAYLVELLLRFAQETKHMRELVKITAGLLRSTPHRHDPEEVAAALALLEPFVDAEADAARAKVAALEKSDREALDEIAFLEPIIALEPDMGEEQEWFALFGQCYDSPPSGLFQYKFCPFNNFLQDGHLLGNYSGWTEIPPDARTRDGQVLYGRAMAFTNGALCMGEPRNATVLMTCGQEDKLLSVSEPTTCVYEGLFSSPSACEIEALRAKHTQLEEAARAAGLPYEPSENLRDLLGL
ncbi:hypothetical protein AB1Y20_011864 [Prymnesium parvum]|uniref:Glucosidase 2 subunit beta n=1 Tax=Prymnesium parvum TaxID=97485 RepID=A0AB34IKM1_PRYPA